MYVSIENVVSNMNTKVEKFKENIRVKEDIHAIYF